MDGKQPFAISFAYGPGKGAAGVGEPNSTGSRPPERPLPRPLRTAQGYLELATGAAAKFGLAPRLRRQTLRTVLRLAGKCHVSGQHRATRQLLIGQALRLLGRYETAVLALQQASSDPTLRRDALIGLAWCHKRLGELDLAIAAISRALATVPEDPTLHYNLACYLALAQQPRAALYELAWALELQPRLQRRAAVEPDFDTLRGLAAFEALIDWRRRVSQRPSGF